MRRIRVRVACEPALLGEVLARACAEVPDIEVVDGADPSPDVVVRTVLGRADDRLLVELGSSPHPRALAVCPATNEIWGWEGDGAESPVERHAGTLENLFRLIRHLGQGDLVEDPAEAVMGERCTGGAA